MECIINRQDQEEKINSMTEDMIGTIIHPGKDKNNNDDQIFQELWDIVKRQEVRFYRI